MSLAAEDCTRFSDARGLFDSAAMSSERTSPPTAAVGVAMPTFGAVGGGAGAGGGAGGVGGGGAGGGGAGGGAAATARPPAPPDPREEPGASRVFATEDGGPTGQTGLRL